MKKVFYTILFSGILTTATMIAPVLTPIEAVANVVTATTTPSQVYINGDLTEFEAYTINDYTYFKLRDVAYALNGTAKQFSVHWNNTEQSIELTKDSSYLALGTEMIKGIIYPTQNATLTTSKIYVDGKQANLQAYTINNNTYFKLRDLAGALNFEVDWDAETSAIKISAKPDEEPTIPSNVTQLNYNLQMIDLDWNIKTGASYYDRWADTVNHHLYIDEEEESLYMFNVSDKIYLTTVKADEARGFILKEQMTLDLELPIFGGFYTNGEHHYIVYGEENTLERTQAEVYRIVQYDLDFNKLQTLSVNGQTSQTSIPFSAGTVAMHEYKGTLVVHTTRQRFKASDGLNHQSQITFIIDTDTMKLQNNVDLYQPNHVSHSFNQFVRVVDGGEHVLLDHGDAFPREVLLHIGNGARYMEVTLLEIAGTVGANATGVNVGGLEESTTSYFVPIHKVDFDKVTTFTSYALNGLEKDERDVILYVVDKEDYKVKEILLQQYVGTNMTSSTPKIFPAEQDEFIVMWEEMTIQKKVSGVKYVKIDKDGNLIGNVQSLPDAKLSDVLPIYYKGEVVWYVNHNLYHLTIL